MDKPVAFYIIHLLGFASVVIAMFSAYFAVFHSRDYNSFCELSFTGTESDPLRGGRKDCPWYAPSRLWRMGILIMCFVGAWYICYAVLKQVFSWMPYDWRDEDGEWQAISVASFLGLMGGMGLYGFVTKIKNLISSYEIIEERHLLDRSVMAAISKLQKCDISANEFYRDYARGMAYYRQQHDQIFNVIDTAYTFKKTIPDNIGTYTWISKNSIYSPVKNLSWQAVDLIGYIDSKEGLRIANMPELLKLLPNSPDESSPDDKVKDWYNYNRRSKEYKIKLIELIVWAEVADTIELISDFIRNKAEWRLA